MGERGNYCATVQCISLALLLLSQRVLKLRVIVDVLISRTKGGSWGVRVLVAQGQVTHQWPGQDWHLTALLPCPRYLCRITLNS